MAAKPYTKLIQNGARISALLINEGTKVLRSRFDARILYKYGTLEKALHDKKEDIKLHFEGNKIRKIPKILTRPQYDQLFPGKKVCSTSEKFDISLMAVLISVVCKEPEPPSTGSWTKPPNPNDESFAADVVRLRTYRNKIYGHISKTGMKNKDFEKNWKQLASVLLRLGAKQDEIAYWKHADIDEERVEILKQRITELIENDLSVMQMYAMELLTITRDDAEFESLKDDMSDIKSFFEERKEFDNFLAGKILKAADEVQGIKQSIDVAANVFRGIEQGLMYNTDTILAEIQQHSAALSSIVTKQAQSDQDSKQLLQNTNELLLRLPINLESCGSLQDIEKEYRHLEDSGLSILILNEPSAEEDCRELGYALGYMPLNIVIDLDHKSLGCTGLYENIRSILTERKSLHVITYKETKSLTDSDKSAVASGLKTLWIQANGCSVKNQHPTLEKFGTAKINIDNLIGEVMKCLPSRRTVSCTTLLMSKCGELMQSAVLKSQDVVDQSSERAEDYISCLRFINLASSENEAILQTMQCIQQNQQKRCSFTGVATFKQLANMIVNVYQKEITLKYWYPGNNYDCYLKCGDMVHVQGCMEFYHRDYGKVNFDSLSAEDIKKRKTAIREIFHKGGELSPEALYLDSHHTDTIYVRRKEMIDIEKFVQDELQSKKSSRKRESSFVTIHELMHEPCSGASTCVKHLLFKLKDKYPCAELLKLNQSVFDTLKELSKASKLPLLLVVNGQSFARSEVNSFRQKLSNDGVHGVIIHTCYLTKKAERPDSIWYIPSVINNENDLESFQNLYKQNVKEASTRRVFLFGLIAFLGEYQRLDPHIQLCCHNLTLPQQSLVRLACNVYKYGRVGIPVRIVENLLSCSSDGSVDGRLGYANDILIGQRECIRPAVMQIVDKTLQSLDALDNPGKLRKFVDDFISLISSRSCTENDITPLVRSVFTQRDREEGLHWSPFIVELEKECGQEYVSSVLERISAALIEYNQGKHIKTLYARYLMMQMNKPEKAITEIREVLELGAEDSVKDTRVTDNILLSAYGSLHNSYVRKSFGNHLSKSVDFAIEQAQIHSIEAIRAFEMAQHSTWNYIEERRDKHSPVPFWSEAKVRCTLLHLILEHKFKNNMRRFHTFIDKADDQLLQCSESKAAKTIDKLESLIDRDLVHDDYPDFTKQNILKVKLDFLALRIDVKHQKSSKALRGQLSKLSPSVCVDFGVIFRQHRQMAKWKELADLGEEDLEFIILQVHRRLSLDSILATNCNDLILAMVHLLYRGHNSVEQINFNLDYVTECANIWVDRFPDDCRAHFILGALNLIRALDEANNNKTFQDAATHFNKCKEICSATKSMKNFKTKRLYVGKGTGLSRLIPKECNTDGSCPLQTFTGRKIIWDTIVARYDRNDSAFKAHISEKIANERVSAPKDQPLVQFEVALAFDNILAFNIRPLPKVA